MTLNSTQIQAFGNCPREWYIRHAFNKGTFIPKPALEKGSLMHLALEAHYWDPGNHIWVSRKLMELKKAAGDQKSLEEILLTFKERLPDVRIPEEILLDPADAEFVLKRFELYCCNYEGRDFEPIEIGGKKAIEVGFSQHIGYFEVVEDGVRRQEPAILEGKLDLIDELKAFRSIRYVDHKTQGRISTLYGKKVQFRNYDLALNNSEERLFSTGYACVNYVGLQQAVNKGTFRRETLVFSAESREVWRKYLLEDIFPRMWRAKQGFENAEARYTSCAGPFQSMPCDFHQICENHGNELVLINQTLADVPVWQSWTGGTK